MLSEQKQHQPKPSKWHFWSGHLLDDDVCIWTELGLSSKTINSMNAMTLVHALLCITTADTITLLIVPLLSAQICCSALTILVCHL